MSTTRSQSQPALTRSDSPTPGRAYSAGADRPSSPSPKSIERQGTGPAGVIRPRPWHIPGLQQPRRPAQFAPAPSAQAQALPGSLAWAELASYLAKVKKGNSQIRFILTGAKLTW